MNTDPTFLAIFTFLLLLVSVLGSDQIRPWRVLALLIIGFLGLITLPGVYSILGPGPAVDSAGQVIRDAEGHTLYRAKQVSSAMGFMSATLYLSLGSIITAFVLLFGLICSHGFGYIFSSSRKD